MKTKHTGYLCTLFVALFSGMNAAQAFDYGEHGDCVFVGKPPGHKHFIWAITRSTFNDRCAKKDQISTNYTALGIHNASEVNLGQYMTPVYDNSSILKIVQGSDTFSVVNELTAASLSGTKLFVLKRENRHQNGLPFSHATDDGNDIPFKFTVHKYDSNYEPAGSTTYDLHCNVSRLPVFHDNRDPIPQEIDDANSIMGQVDKKNLSCVLL